MDQSNIMWYDLRKEYLDERIYPSMRRSIIDNFAFRVFSHDKPDASYPFPIKLIRTVFTNASKLKKEVEKGTFDEKMLDEAIVLREKLENAVEMTVERILLCVAEPGYEVSETINPATDLPEGMWGYPVVAVKELGFSVPSGEIFIKLYREKDNIRQLYSLNPDTSKWEKVTGVEKLSQLYLKRIPGMVELLNHNMPDLEAIRELNSKNLYADLLKAKDYNQHILLWKWLLPLLPNLLRDVLAVLAQYNIILTLSSHKRR